MPAWKKFQFNNNRMDDEKITTVISPSSLRRKDTAPKHHKNTYAHYIVNSYEIYTIGKFSTSFEDLLALIHS